MVATDHLVDVPLRQAGMFQSLSGFLMVATSSDAGMTK